jgi:hypothetical protein
MAFKMKGNPIKLGTIQGTAGHSSALKMKMEKDAAAKLRKEAAMKLKKESAMKMKMEAAAKMKKESAMKAAKPDFPDIDGDGNTTESMKKAAADKKSGAKMKKPSPNKVLLEGPIGTKANTDSGKKYDPYAEAKKRDPKLDSYVKERKKHKPGSAEYEAVQAKINKAYGKTRSSKLKAAQIAAQKKKDAVKPTKTEKVVSKGETKKAKITAKAAKRTGEVDENVTRKTAKIAKKEARKKHGRGSKEHQKAKLAHLKAKQSDRAGGEGGRKQGLFRKLSTNINVRRQARTRKKLEAMDAERKSVKE